MLLPPSSEMVANFPFDHLFSSGLVDACRALPACHRRIAGSNLSTATLLLPSARRFKSVHLLNWRYYSCRTFSCEQFQVSHLSKLSRNVFVKWHYIAQYKSAYTLHENLGASKMASNVLLVALLYFIQVASTQLVHCQNNQRAKPACGRGY